MFGKSMIKKKNYLLLSVRKNNIQYCGIYSFDGTDEIITTITSGDIFYNL